MTILDLCSYLGLGAAGAATVNLLLGLLISLRYSPVRQWPHRRLNVFALHQWTAYLAVALTLTHPAVLLFQTSPKFGVVDLLWPVHSPLQPWINSTGAAAMYLMLLIVGSSVLRQRLGRPATPGRCAAKFRDGPCHRIGWASGSWQTGRRIRERARRRPPWRR
jgi:Ferric reductase like transmembrane component